jgi:hypothetical protein
MKKPVSIKTNDVLLHATLSVILVATIVSCAAIMVTQNGDGTVAHEILK